jgi:hypothetical protein
MAATEIAADHFVRNLSNGWGEANEGGSYTLSGPTADFWVSTATYRRGLGYMRASGPGQRRAAMLRQAQASNIEIGFSVAVAGAAGDGAFYVYAVARQANGREVRAKLTLNRNCTVSTNASVVDDVREQPLGSAVNVAGVSWCGRETVSLRAQVSGSTVRIKAWGPATGSPDTWLWTANSSSLPRTGAVGLRVYVSSSARSGTTFRFYNWTARAL